MHAHKAIGSIACKGTAVLWAVGRKGERERERERERGGGDFSFARVISPGPSNALCGLCHFHRGSVCAEGSGGLARIVG